MEKHSEAKKTTTNVEIVDINYKILENEFNWLKELIRKRIGDNEIEKRCQFSSGMPEINSGQKSFYADLLIEFNLNAVDRLLLVSALAPQILPQLFNEALEEIRAKTASVRISIGGYFDKVNFSFVPTIHTLLFLLEPSDFTKRTKLFQYLFNESVLVREQIIHLVKSPSSDDNRPINFELDLAPEYMNYLLSGKKPRPDFGKNFPATIITTGLEWSDLVVPETTFNELQRITKWQSHGSSLIQETAGKLNGSFTCLFYGASGSGKTLAVQLLGKSLGVDVFRIDLSMVVSKYIGETEKNLSFLFDRAKNKDWILFFDEADALFGKRTDIKESKDKWANLEMSYLLQRMEDHNGLTVLATNFRNNLDLALSRRFQSVIYFAKPDKEQRKALWKKLMPLPYTYDSNINFDNLAHFELTGGNITNVIKAACLDAKYAGNHVVSGADLYEGIKREFAKENRILTQ